MIMNRSQCVSSDLCRVGLSLAFLTSVAFAGDVTTLTPSAAAEIESGVVTPRATYLHTRGAIEPHIATIDTALEFGLSQLDPDLPVQSAILRLTVESFRRSGTGPNWMDIFVHGYAGDNQITPSDALVENPIAGPYHASWIFSPLCDDMSSIDVTDVLQQQLNQGASASGFLLRAQNFYGGGRFEIGITTDFPFPQLIVTQVPEPTAFAGFVVAAITLFARRR